MDLHKSLAMICVTIISVLPGCAFEGGVRDAEYGNISAFTSAVRQTTNSVNITAPEFNNMNTCPKVMTRVNHTAGGGGDAHVGTTQAGTSFDVNADFGTGHGCSY